MTTRRFAGILRSRKERLPELGVPEQRQRVSWELDGGANFHLGKVVDALLRREQRDDSQREYHR